MKILIAVVLVCVTAAPYAAPQSGASNVKVVNTTNEPVPVAVQGMPTVQIGNTTVPVSGNVSISDFTSSAPIPVSIQTSTKIIAGLSVVGTTPEAANVNVLIGPRDSAAESAFANGLANPKGGYTSFIASVAPNLMVKCSGLQSKTRKPAISTNFDRN